MHIMGFTISSLDATLSGVVAGLWLLYGVLHAIDRTRERRRG